MSKSVAILAATATLVIGVAVYFLISARKKKTVESKTDENKLKQDQVSSEHLNAQPVLRSNDVSKPQVSDVTTDQQQKEKILAYFGVVPSSGLEPEVKVSESEPEFDIPNEEIEKIVSSVIYESAPKLDVSRSSVAESFASIIGESPDQLTTQNDLESLVTVVPISFQNVESGQSSLAGDFSIVENVAELKSLDNSKVSANNESTNQIVPEASKTEHVEAEENVDNGNSFGHVGKLDVGLLSNPTDSILLKEVGAKFESFESKIESAVDIANLVIEEVCENVVDKVLHAVDKSTENIDKSTEHVDNKVLKTTESDQVFTSGMNDSSENVEKENVGDLTWAADDSDFSDKSTTMLVDDDDSVWSHSVTDTNGTSTDFARQVSVDEEFAWLDDNSPENSKPEDSKPEDSKPETNNPELSKPDPPKLYSDVVKEDTDKSKLVTESTDNNSHGDESYNSISETSTEF